MSRFCGDLRQVAMVVHDADAAMNQWVRVLGVGPFVVRRDVQFDDFQYMGQPSASPVLTIGMAHSGPLQIEIIQQHNEAPSAYRDFLANRPEGLQHCCSWFEDRPAYQTGYDRLKAEGLVCVHEGSARGFDIRFAYFRDPANPFGLQMEIAEALNPLVRGRMEQLQALAADWDGTAPIRENGFVSNPAR